MKKLVLFLPIILFFFLYSCQGEDDCIGCNLNPKIKLRFDALFTKKLTEEQLLGVKAVMSDLRDSLKNEQLADDQRAIMLSELSKLREDSVNFTEKYDLLRLGKTKIDAVYAPGSKSFEQFQDTLIRDFSIPVDMNHDTSTFYFQYFGFTDTLQIYYQRDVRQTLDGVRMKINGIGVNKEISTFDSIQVKCYKSECSNDLTTIYIYF